MNDILQYEAADALSTPDVADERRGGSVFVADFHRSGNSAAYRTFGWSGQEETHVWSVGGSCGLRLPPMAEVTPLFLDVDLANTTVKPLLTTACVQVSANGHVIGSTIVEGRSRLRFSIPAANLQAGEPIILRFEHPNFVCPHMMDWGTERRVLGLCFYSVCVYPPWMRMAAEALVSFPEGCPLIEADLPKVALHAGGGHSVYRFGADEPDRALLVKGWRFDESGNAWADDRECHVEVPAADLPGHYWAQFAIAPLFIRSVLKTQRITILFGGAVVGQFCTGIKSILSVSLPSDLINPGGALRFTFVVPDGVAMHEFDLHQDRHFLSFILDAIEIIPVPPRHAAWAGLRADDLAAPPPIAVSDQFLNETVDDLPAALKNQLGIEMSEVMGLFESLGDNCSFGLAQRKAGCEVLGLLRFASTPLKNLLTALDDEFRAVSDKTQIEMHWVRSDPGEFIMYVKRYGLQWHTSVHDAGADPVALFAQQAMRLSYLRRKLYESLMAGRKIFTISRAEPRKHPIPMPDADELDYWEEKPEPLRLAEMFSLFLKLNEYGTNTVLYLTRCEGGRRSGTVELIVPGLMRGYVDDFVISNDMDTADHAAWMRIAANAWLLHHDANADFWEKFTE